MTRRGDRIAREPVILEAPALPYPNMAPLSQLRPPGWSGAVSGMFVSDVGLLRWPGGPGPPGTFLVLRSHPSIGSVRAPRLDSERAGQDLRTAVDRRRARCLLDADGGTCVACLPPGRSDRRPRGRAGLRPAGDRNPWRGLAAGRPRPSLVPRHGLARDRRAARARAIGCRTRRAAPRARVADAAALTRGGLPVASRACRHEPVHRVRARATDPRADRDAPPPARPRDPGGGRADRPDERAPRRRRRGQRHRAPGPHPGRLAFRANRPGCPARAVHRPAVRGTRRRR